MSTHNRSAISPQCEQCATRGSTVFCDLSPADVGAMSHSKIHRMLRRGETVYCEGDEPAGIYCLYDGAIKIFRNGRDGREQILRLVRPGEIFGYRALLSAQPHTNSAAALDEVSLCHVPRAMFLSMAAEKPAFSFKLLELLSGELRNTQNRIVDLAQRSLRERLAEALLLLRQTFGFQSDGVTIDTRMTRIEIAEIVGAATESVIRQLAQFEREGLVELNGRRIKILTADGLLEAANADE